MSRRFGITRIMAVAASVLFSLVGTNVQVAGANDVIDECSIAAQAASACMGYFEVDGLTQYEAAVEGALVRGDLVQAEAFYNIVANGLPEADNALIRQALQAEREQQGAGLAVLTPATPDSNSYIDSPQAPQDSRGFCCATSSTSWVLNRGTKTYSYGYCNIDRCYVLGYVSLEIRSNVFYFYNVHYYHYMSSYSGVSPYVNPVTVKMYRDIADNPDQYITSYSCGTGSLPLSCGDQERSSGTSVGQYYYIESIFQLNTSGHPPATAKFQTRRWKVQDSYHAYYPAYSTGG